MFHNIQSAIEAIQAHKNTPRKKVEAKILHIINTLDPSGFNGKRYQEHFEKWSDRQFHSYMEGIRDGTIKLILYVPNLKINIKLKDIFKAAEEVNLTLFERIRLWDSTTQRYYTTPQSYPVLLLPVRRLKQYLMGKISVPEGDSKIDAFSGQVTKPDKGASISSVEMQTILSKDLTVSIQELIRIRGGDIHAYGTFRGQLEETGAVSLNDIPGDSRARSSVIFGVYLRGAHIDSNV